MVAYMQDMGSVSAVAKPWSLAEGIASVFWWQPGPHEFRTRALYGSSPMKEFYTWSEVSVALVFVRRSEVKWTTVRSTGAIPSCTHS